VTDVEFVFAKQACEFAKEAVTRADSMFTAHIKGWETDLNQEQKSYYLDFLRRTGNEQWADRLERMWNCPDLFPKEEVLDINTISES